MESWSPPNAKYPPPKAGEPPLHRAARLGDAETIRRLVGADAAIDAPFDIALDPGACANPATPLMLAAGSGDGASVDTVRLLLQLGANPRVVLGNHSAATFACAGLGWNYRPGGDAARLKLLLASGSPLPTHPAAANRLLCEVAAAGDIERLDVLLEHGLNARGYWNADEARARALASQESMRQYSANQPDPFADLPDETRAALAESRDQFEKQNLERQCSAPLSFEIPLFRAAESGNVECVERLLAAGADPLVRDDARRTAMYYANSSAVVRRLVESGTPLEDADTYGWSPLAAAVGEGESAIPRIQALLDAGANVNAVHDRGYTVFMSAVGSMERNPELLRLLVAAGADPHAITELGYNAFHAAIDVNGEANSEDSVRETLEYLRHLQVNLEHRNNRGQTPLARAIHEGTALEVRVLCELGANPNAVCPLHTCGDAECERQELPLLFHAIHGYRGSTIAALLEAGADPLAEDAEGCTPLVRAVAALCAESNDYESAFREFFAGLADLSLPNPRLAADCRSFAAAVAPALRRYVEEFASGIPLSSDYGYAEQLRRERVDGLVALCVHDRWGRR